MPIYEYTCRSCGENFEVLVRSHADEAAVACPKDGSRDVEKRFSTFAAVASAPAAPAPCAQCGNPGGPGACQFAN